LRKARIPTEDAVEILHNVCGNLAGILKAWRARLGEELVNDLFTELREADLTKTTEWRGAIVP
jgi:hypothetical protein